MQGYSTPKNLFSLDHLDEMFRYDPDTGVIYWRNRPEWSVQMRAKYAGTIAGNFTHLGYVNIRIRIDGRKTQWLGHRIAWKMFHRTDPDVIDHINMNPSDNRIVNLRNCSQGQNSRNTEGWASKALPKGVYMRPESGRYRSIICVNRKNLNLGTFDTVEEATAAYAIAASKLHGEFARTE